MHNYILGALGAVVIYVIGTVVSDMRAEHHINELNKQHREVLLTYEGKLQKAIDVAVEANQELMELRANYIDAETLLEEAKLHYVESDCINMPVPDEFK